MPFTPKFVDLVRNATSVQGTGPVTLGAAVSGFTGIAAAVAPTQQFYYCIQSVDKPSEREVGRGTMQANGTIAREAISGTLTSFTSGSKTIALVAAAEWFSASGQMVNGGSDSLAALATTNKTSLLAAVNEVAAAAAAATAIATAAGNGAPNVLFTAAAGTAVPAIRTMVDTVGYSVAGLGGATYAFDAAVNAAFVAAHPGWAFLAADGRGFRLKEDVLRLEMFGAIPGNALVASPDCYPAWLAMVDYQNTYPKNLISTAYKTARKVEFPGNKYFFSETLDLKNNFWLQGQDLGMPAGNGTILQWPTNKTGIRAHTYNTIGTTVEGVPTTGGQSVIENLTLRGDLSGGEGEYHGFHMRGFCALRNVMIWQFQGDGIYISAGAGAGGANEGNANLFRLDRIRIQNCRNGVFVDLADANAGLGTLVDVSSNRQWGIWDTSFLGNTWVGCHSDSNGLVVGFPASVVSHAGLRYCVKVGQEVAASTNAPSGTNTDNIWWYYIGAGGVSAPNNIPAWVSGMTLRAGGGMRSDGINAQTLFVGCYVESGQGLCQGAAPSMSIGGIMAATWRGGHGHLANNATGVLSEKAMGSREPSGVMETFIKSDVSVGVESHLSVKHATKAALGYDLGWVNNNLTWRYANSGVPTQHPYVITGPLSTNNIGTHKINFPILFGIADKKMLNGTAAPATGAYVVGDICWNTTPVAAGVPGWVCTTAGTPGTWKAMAALAA